MAPRPEITAAILGVPVERLDAEVASIFEPMSSLWTNDRLSTQQLREKLGT